MKRDKFGRFTSEGMKGNKINKGKTPWNKGLRGVMVAWNKGLKTGIVTSGVFKKGNKINLGRKYPHVANLPQNFKFKDMKGENNPAYTGLMSKRHNIKQVKWNEIRKLVLERDLFKCKRCGKNHHKNVLDIHHKIPYSISKDNSLDNLTTLCKSCHKKEEWKYNKKRSSN